MAIETRKTQDGNELQFETDAKGQLIKANYVDHYGQIKPITDANMLNSLSLAVTTQRIGSHIQHDAERLKADRDAMMERTRLDTTSPVIKPYDEPYQVADLTAHNFLQQAAAAFSRTERAIDKLAQDPRSEGHGLNLTAKKPSTNGPNIP